MVTTLCPSHLKVYLNHHIWIDERQQRRLHLVVRSNTHVRFHVLERANSFEGAGSGVAAVFREKWIL